MWKVNIISQLSWITFWPVNDEISPEKKRYGLSESMCQTMTFFSLLNFIVNWSKCCPRKLQLSFSYFIVFYIILSAKINRKFLREINVIWYNLLFWIFLFFTVERLEMSSCNLVCVWSYFKSILIKIQKPFHDFQQQGEFFFLNFEKWKLSKVCLNGTAIFLWSDGMRYWFGMNWLHLLSSQ